MNVPPWSFSSLTKFETCPRQYQHVRVLRDVKEPPTEHTIWGNKVHKALELRLLEKTPLPTGMEQWEAIASKFDNTKGQLFTEQQYALTRNLEPCAWNAPDCWHRGIIDVGIDGGKKAMLADWKTGKVKPSDQLKLSAMSLMSAKGYITKVSTAFIWLAYDKVTKEVYTREHLSEAWEGFIVRADRLQAAYEKDRWPARPSGLCKGWCPVPYKMCEFSERR